MDFLSSYQLRYSPPSIFMIVLFLFFRVLKYDYTLEFPGEIYKLLILGSNTYYFENLILLAY